MSERLFPFTNETISKARKAINNDSYFLMPKIYSTEFCSEIKTEMDKISFGPDVEIRHGETETRIWSAENSLTGARDFFKDSNRFLSSVLNKKKSATTILAIKNKPLTENDQKSKTGRWHADSWNSQLKLFLFLSDTSEESGPLEFIPNTHKPFFRFKKGLEPGFYFNHFSVLSRTEKFRQYQSIPDSKISSLFNEGYSSKPMIVEAGTVLLINSAKLIHRARPCTQGERYALTAYY